MQEAGTKDEWGLMALSCMVSNGHLEVARFWCGKGVK